jgi:uncharacterized membrane-anchored protein
MPHALRGAVLHEVHARPFHPVPTPRRLLHFGFLTDAAQAAADRAALEAFCLARGAPPPSPGVRHHQVALPATDLPPVGLPQVGLPQVGLPQVGLQWEQHSEFTTYTWEVVADPDLPFARLTPALRDLIAALPQPGQHIVAADLCLMAEADVSDLAAPFDPTSLAASLVDDGAAIAATDFRLTEDGVVRLLVLDRGLTALRAGALTQRLLEIETYRTLALLGLPEAHQQVPAVHRIEAELARIAGAMTGTASLDADHRLLDDLTALAAEVEATAVVSGVRFSASRAYDEIVQQRLATIREVPLPGTPTLAAFLARRMAPAMRTCQMLQARQADLATKLARAANLLRTRVDVAIEQQNRDLLRSMNARTRLQLRLQQTVEGLSIAAISYYVVALIAHVTEGVRAAGYLPLPEELTTAISVPVVVVAIALVVRRIRRRHSAEE